jgi:hypothetical protein
MYPRLGDAVGNLVELSLGFEVEDKERLRMWPRCSVIATGGELQKRSRAGYLEKNSVVTVVTRKPADLGEPDAVSVETGDPLELVGVPSDPQSHSV